MTKTCPNCGHVNESTSNFCVRCRTALDEAPIKSKENTDSLKGTWNNMSTGVKVIFMGVVPCSLGIIVLLVIGAMIAPDVSTINATMEYTFENQYIKFTIPTEQRIADISTNEYLDVQIWDGGKLIGEITAPNNMSAATSFIDPNRYRKITVAGKDAYEYSDGIRMGTYVTLEDNTYLWIDFEPQYQYEYNIIKSTLRIKKNPI